MTTEEKIKEIGSYKPINFISESDLCTYQQGLERGAREMATWKENQLIEKACQWLLLWNTAQVIKQGSKAVLGCKDFTIQVSEFRKAMEGGEE